MILFSLTGVGIAIAIGLFLRTLRQRHLHQTAFQKFAARAQRTVPIWTYVAMANTQLMERPHTIAPALVIGTFDPVVGADGKAMLDMSIALSVSDDPALEAIMADEAFNEHRRRLLPASLTGTTEVFAFDLMINSDWLPGGDMNVAIPCMAEPGSQGIITMLPIALLKEVFSRYEEEDDSLIPEEGWGEGPSIYDHLRRHLPEDEAESPLSSMTLPDEDRFREGSSQRYAPGAHDEIMAQFGMPVPEDYAAAVAARLNAFCHKPGEETQKALYEVLCADPLPPAIGDIFEMMAADHPDPTRAVHLARMLTTRSADRNPVKFGIALLSSFRDLDHLEILKTLARHDEFTRYCIVGLRHQTDHVERELAWIARRVKGWGRIHAIRQMKNVTDPELRNWLLREGCRNEVMYEYTAYPCAMEGDLVSALAAPEIDGQLFSSAAILLNALLQGGPAEEIRDYEHAPQAISHFMRHAQEQPLDSDHIQMIQNLQAYLTDDDGEWWKRRGEGWSEELRMDVLAQCQSLLDSNP